MKRKFHIRDILTVITGRLLTLRKSPNDNGIGNIFELLNFMTGDNLYSRQLGRAANACTSEIYRQLPVLTIKNVNDWMLQLEGAMQKQPNHHEIEKFIERKFIPAIIEQVGEYHELSPLDEYQVVD